MAANMMIRLAVRPRSRSIVRKRQVGQWEETNSYEMDGRPEKSFRAGATPVCAAVEPPQTRFVPIVTSGVAPALEELPLVMHSSSDETLEALIETQ